MHPSRSLRDFFKKGDVLLLGLCLLASTVGLVLIYSATRYDPALHEYVQKQAMFICLGVVAYIIITFVDVEFLVEKWWKVFLALGLLVILLIKPFGEAGDTGIEAGFTCLACPSVFSRERLPNWPILTCWPGCSTMSGPWGSVDSAPW